MSITVAPYLEAIFSTLLEIYNPENLSLKTKTVENKYIDYFQNLKMNVENSIPLPRGGIAILYSHEDNINIALLGTSILEKELEKPNNNFLYMEDEGKNPALFLHLAKKFTSYLKLKEEYSNKDGVINILDRAKDDPSYEFDILDIINYHNNIYVFNIPNDSTLTPENLEETIILLLISLPSLLHNGDKKYLELINLIIESEVNNDIKYIDRGMILHSISAYYPRHAFLDIYRCLEKLFYFPEIYELSNNLSNNLEERVSISKLKSICIESLSWTPKENTSIQKLLKIIFLNKNESDKSNITDKEFCNDKAKEICENFIQEMSIEVKHDDTNIEKVEKIALYIYKYRNSLVHHEDKEYRDKIKKLSENEWQHIASFIANTLLTFSTKFSKTVQP